MNPQVAADHRSNLCPSAFRVAAIHEGEQQLRAITDQLLAGGSDRLMPICRKSEASSGIGLEAWRTLLAGILLQPGKNP